MDAVGGTRRCIADDADVDIHLIVGAVIGSIRVAAVEEPGKKANKFIPGGGGFIDYPCGIYILQVTGGTVETVFNVADKSADRNRRQSAASLAEIVNRDIPDGVGFIDQPGASLIADKSADADTVG